jgi:ribosomal protein L15, bacterial/organelle
MRLNTLRPAAGAKFKRVRIGRGMGSGLGKTCGFGHKGQASRSGYSRKAGFEGGQMPLYRRLPKFGFVAPKSQVAVEIRLSDLEKMSVDKIGLEELRGFNLINKSDLKVKVKVILSGKLTRKVTLTGIKVTSGARKVIEELGGKVE